MAVWDSKILWGFVYLLAGAVGLPSIQPSIKYTNPGCAVSGSTVTLPCRFTPLRFGAKGSIAIIRVLWCKNHEICQGTTPTEYDSESQENNPRYRYLGDKKGNCTLQITDCQKDDNTTLRFRMEANDRASHFTGREGVNVTVIDRPQMTIQSSSDREFKRGETVTLVCNTKCTFHQLKISWFRDDHVLQETGPTLQLGALTAEDSGNYTCNLKENRSALSQPYSLRVAIEEGEGVNEAAGVNASLIVGVVFGVLLALLSLILVACIIRKKQASANPEQLAMGGDVEPKPADYISNTLQNERGHRQEPSWAADDVSYAPVQFKHKNQTRQAEEAMEAEDTIIYSSIVRG